MKLILCSKSARRRKLIKMIARKSVICYPRVDENIRARTPVQLVRALALLKARSAAGRFREGVALGADTIVVLNGKIIGKPKNRQDAEMILGSLSGTVHRVYTGFALSDCSTGRSMSGYDVSRVKMRKLSTEEIRSLSRKHLDKAGAYAVQEKKDSVIEKIYGDYHNVVGLPVRKIKTALRKFTK